MGWEVIQPLGTWGRTLGAYLFSFLSVAWNDVIPPFHCNNIHTCTCISISVRGSCHVLVWYPSHRAVKEYPSYIYETIMTQSLNWSLNQSINQSMSSNPVLSLSYLYRKWRKKRREKTEKIEKEKKRRKSRSDTYNGVAKIREAFPLSIRSFFLSFDLTFCPVPDFTKRQRTWYLLLSSSSLFGT